MAYNLRTDLRFSRDLKLVPAKKQDPNRLILMKQKNIFSRAFLSLTLLTLLCAGIFAPHVEVVEARPAQAADKVSVLISEFRTRGAGGADDEFVEIYNATGNAVPLLNWEIRKSSGCGSTITSLATITANISLAPGQYYLVGKSPEFSGTPDLTYTSTIADDGGIALLDASDQIVDQVGLCSTTDYKEGTSLSPLSGTADQSYERKAGGSAGNCRDTDNNSTDFTLNSSSSNPQNFSAAPLPCLVATNVSSTNGTYTANQPVDITVTYSNNVNVAGSPILLLETGSTDRNAAYLSGSGTNSLVFRYTVVAGDTSGDLDYTSANALSLNGGSITGALGDATLVLPQPGQAGSLGANNAIIIDNAADPSVLSFRRQTPSSSSTDADSLIFRVIFSEAVTGVDLADFVATGTTGTPTTINNISSNTYDVTISGGNLSTYNGVVGLNLSTTPTIMDITGNSLPAGEPPTDETYIEDNIVPSVTINQAISQSDPAGVLPVNFTIVFSEPINTGTFTSSDITQNGSASFITWNITDSGDQMNFTLSAVASGNGTLVPSIAANRVTDLAGNNNTASTSTDNSVTLNDITSPTVTINQASAQSDPTSTLPINFTVIFSEPINPSVFTTSDITQSGTATGITWSIVNSGNSQTFTLSATAVTGFGTLIPSIAANRVTDWAGNNNTASTSTDNSITYAINTASARSVIINEVAWAGTTSSLTDDEWIELYNPRSTSINITGWTLRAADGTPNITLNGTIPSGGYFLLERDNDNTVSDILADQVYTGDLSNSGEALTLRDGANNVIDTANGNGGGWPRGSSSTYGTMERSGTSAENDGTWLTNTGIKKNGKNANNGDILGTPKSSNSVLPTSTSTPNKVATSTFAPPVVRPIINEFLARPGFDWNQDGNVDVFDEFIEIKNIGVIDVDLGGWRLDDEANLGSSAFTLPDIILQPGERIVFYGLETNILLSDGGDTVRLLNPSGKIYDSYTYAIAKVEDESVCRLPDGVGDWYEDCTPTPNFTNTRDGTVPAMPEGDDFESPVCELPDTLPAAFLFAECRGYGANIWNSFYWDEPGWQGDQFVPENMSKWASFVE